jgi:hypothetical protein
LKIPRDPTFEAEERTFDLRWSCEDCALFDADRERCAHGFPTQEHRRAHNATTPLLVFCKDFELG